MASEDTIRVLRVIEYVGKRSRVESTVAGSLHGTKLLDDLTIRVATIGEYPEILTKGQQFGEPKFVRASDLDAEVPRG